MVWYSNLFKNFPQFAVIHTVKGFSTLREADVDFFFFLKSPPLFFFPMIEQILAI